MSQAHCAHVQGDAHPHLLEDHLRAVAALAGTFAVSYGEDWTRLAGLWHDLGKYRGSFQRYIRLVNGHEAHIEGKLPADSDKTHSAAGAMHAMAAFEKAHGRDGAHAARLLAYVIAGHHAGLGNWETTPLAGGLDKRLHPESASSQLEYRQAFAACSSAAPELLSMPAGFDLCATLSRIPAAQSGGALFGDARASPGADRAERPQCRWPRRPDQRRHA